MLFIPYMLWVYMYDTVGTLFCFVRCCLLNFNYCNRSSGGMGVLVKEEFDPERPPETNASFSLRNPDEVQAFLAMLVTHAKGVGSATT